MMVLLECSRIIAVGCFNGDVTCFKGCLQRCNCGVTYNVIVTGVFHRCYKDLQR